MVTLRSHGKVVQAAIKGLAKETIVSPVVLVLMRISFAKGFVMALQVWVTM